MDNLTATYGNITVEFSIKGDAELFPYYKILEIAADVIKDEYPASPFEEQDFKDNVIIKKDGKII